ncbi:MAG: M20/M25/M40 family metallo-hydrolase [Eubacteriales bacterium]|nr:M20/M25/M40 family metallo-hydrolase [Eubacteriales bacterium]
MGVWIDRKRLLDLFMSLTSIDSVSLGERQMADRLREELLSLGFSVEEDMAGETCQGNAGNLYGYLPGALPGDPLLFCAHMDTVEPGLQKEAFLGEDGRIVSRGDTVLGADDVCGLAEILEAVRALREQGIPHRSLEVLFPMGEELFLKGTNVFDFSRIRSREAYVLDLSGPVGAAAIKAPSLISFTFSVKGKASHAGFAPEEGIHAIACMSRAVSRLPMGRIGEDTTLNVGFIQGGGMVNIVPQSCVCKGEIRSYSHERACEVLRETEEVFREALEGTGASYTLEHSVDLQAYEIPRDAPVVERFLRVCRDMGREPSLTSTYGGSDNHNFFRNHISGIVLSCGMYQCHGTGEYTTLEDLEAGAALVAGLLTC